MCSHGKVQAGDNVEGANHSTISAFYILPTGYDDSIGVPLVDISTCSTTNTITEKCKTHSISGIMVETFDNGLGIKVLFLKT